jgi:hypothetical protein
MSGDEMEDEQSLQWEELYATLLEFLQQHGTEGVNRSADFWLDDDNLGTMQQKIYVRNLKLLDPVIVSGLQRMLMSYPGWEIAVAVSVPGADERWPDMGLTVRNHEIIDGLQREYLPEPCRHYFYAGSRTGTDRD